MDNAIVIDGVLAVVLIAGALIGARRGLIKSLAGLVVVIAALVGSVLLADMLTPPITDVIAPKVEDSVVKSFTDAVDKMTQENASTGRQTVLELLDEYGVVGETAQKILEPLVSGAQSAASQAKERAAEAFRAAISGTIRTLVQGTVHAVLVLVLYIVLLFVLRLLTKALDLVFDLPALSTLNGVGGAVLGFLEAALLLYVVVYIASRLGVAAVTDHAEDTRLLPIFLNHSPVELVSTLT